MSWLRFKYTRSISETPLVVKLDNELTKTAYSARHGLRLSHLAEQKGCLKGTGKRVGRSYRVNTFEKIVLMQSRLQKKVRVLSHSGGTFIQV